MIHTDEDDEFERIEREAKLRQGQPYHYEINAIQAAINIEREACARLVDEYIKETDNMEARGCLASVAYDIRARGNK